MSFQSHSYKANTGKIACLVCGFGGRIRTYSNAINALMSAGYTVVAYEYEEDVFSKGNPLLLPELINEITADFKKQSANYSSILTTGVSLGAYIAFNVQRRIPAAKHGIYGTAGISVAHAIFTAKVFRKFRTTFEKNGFTERLLEDTWKDIEILSDLELDDSKSLVIIMGGLDRIVRYKTASQMMEAWKNRGIKVEYYSKRGLGHATTIHWYKRHLRKLLENSANYLDGN